MLIRTRTTAGIVFAAMTLVLGRPGYTAPHRDEAVYRAAEASRGYVLDLLKSIVNIDSGSGYIAGGKQVEEILAARLQSIGAEVRYVSTEAPGLPENLVAVLHGTGSAKDLIIAHFDTVFGSGTATRRPYQH